MKLKGQTIKTGKREYVLKEQLGEGGFSTIYETNQPEVICKVQVLMNAEMVKAYTKEKYLPTNPQINNEGVVASQRRQTLRQSRNGNQRK
jgi:hypothetical protein